MHTMKNSKILIIVLVLIISGGLVIYKINDNKYVKDSVPEAVSIDSIVEQQDSVVEEPPAKIPRTPDEPEAFPTASTPPSELNLAMTFYSQAPFGNWDEPWQNACEEASVLLVANAYYKHNWTREEFRDQISALVDWQKEVFGYYKDTNTEQMVQILKEFLNLKSVVHTNPTFEDIQKILSQGHLIVAPLAGKKLRNPFYTNGGPEYHVMVIKGYKEGRKVITQDVGTSRGEDYVYSWEILNEAIHDFSEPIENGDKLIIEVLPPA